MRKRYLILITLLGANHGHASSEKRDEVFGKKPWHKVESNSYVNSPTSPSAPTSSVSESNSTLSSALNLLTAIVNSSNQNSSTALQSPNNSYLLASNDINISSGSYNQSIYEQHPVQGYFDIALLMGATDHQGGGIKIKEAMQEIGSVGATYGLQVSYRHTVGDTERLRIGASLLITDESSQQKSFDFNDEMHFSSTMLGFDTQYYFGSSGSYGPYVRASIGPIHRSWKEVQTIDSNSYEREDSSDWGFGSVLGMGYSSEPATSPFAFYTEITVATSSVLGPEQIGTIPTTQVLGLIGIQWH
jgi:hypothetical protein